VIDSFGDKEAEKVWGQEVSLKLPRDIQQVALRKMLMVDAAETLEDLRAPPNNHLEKLKGSRKGQFSVRINDQWRVCFHFHKGHATNVSIVDYHQ
jgi:proteic killer suppression protein